METSIWHELGIAGAIVYVIRMRVTNHWFDGRDARKAKIAGLYMIYMIYVGGYPNADCIAEEMSRRLL